MKFVKLECLYHLAKVSGFMYNNSSWISDHVLDLMYSKIIFDELSGTWDLRPVFYCCSVLL